MPTKQERDLLYAFKIKHDGYYGSGFEFRNSSNGYYGGWMDVFVGSDNLEGFTELTEDF